MATWTPLLRPRVRLDSRLWLHVRTHLQGPSPAALEIETMRYPTAHPDPSTFEPMSDEYAVSTPRTHSFTPRTPSDTLLALVSKRDFRAAESLRKEIFSHHVPISHHVLYLRAALYTLTQSQSKSSEKARSDAFEAWLSLAPDYSADGPAHPFYDIRRRLFRSMDRLNLDLIYRFGIVLASKGYHAGHAAVQVVSTLARYAQPSVVARYLREMEVASREYHHKKDTVPPSDLFARMYSLSIRTVALRGEGDAALDLIFMAHSRGIRIPDFTLNMVVKHAPDRQVAMDRIRTTYPSWTMQETNPPVRVECDAQETADIAALATRLRALRHAIRSPSLPSPHVLHSFITSYQALGRTRAVTLLQSLAYRNRKATSTWVLARMLHHRSRLEPNHLLCVFAHHFHPVGVPHKHLLSLVKGKRGSPARKDVQRWLGSPWLVNEKLWPSPHHTALVWDAIVSLSPKNQKEALYTLLLALVQKSRRPAPPVADTDRPRVQLSPETYDAAHFSPFVSSLARRTPTGAARVLHDMVALGIEPSVVQWSMVARGFAQHHDPVVALGVLDRLEARWRSQGGTEGALLGIHTNVLRGFVVAGDVVHAREVERRLVTRFGYRVGTRPATDASIALLRSLESSDPTPDRAAAHGPT